jgi:hypothetical protein
MLDQYNPEFYQDDIKRVSRQRLGVANREQA